MFAALRYTIQVGGFRRNLLFWSGGGEVCQSHEEVPIAPFPAMGQAFYTHSADVAR
jgi:hypothetical protein